MPTLPVRTATLAALAMLATLGCHPAAPPSTDVARTLAVSPLAGADTLVLRRDITYLASDALEGRLTGTPGNDSAAAYIARRYGTLGLDTLAALHGDACTAAGALPAPATDTAADGETFDAHIGFGCTSAYLQPFVAASVAAAHAGLPARLPTQNVAALIPGTDPALRGQVVVLGAHFDHLGRSAFNALDPDAGRAIRHGADDNASGTAAVMELARLFARRPARRSILVVNFTGEELGLLGSQHFVEHPPVPLDSVVAMLNFDMVGRMRDDKLIVYGVATATEWRGILDTANLAPAIRVVAIGDGFGPSDQSSFYSAGMPVLHFFTDIHEDYHRATDVASKIDVADEARVVDLAERVARAVANRPARLTFVKGTPRPQMSDQPGNGAWFGSVPDMGAADVVGVRLAGVTPGSPAEQAGARKGDILVEFGGMSVKDLYGFTDALRVHKPGDVVQVVVLRGGERVTLTATLGRR